MNKHLRLLKKKGGELVKQASVEFRRPKNYFMEMVKSDEHVAKMYAHNRKRTLIDY
jgi:hypothetical protein